MKYEVAHRLLEKKLYFLFLWQSYYLKNDDQTWKENFRKTLFSL